MKATKLITVRLGYDGRSPKNTRCMVEADGSVKVWDCVAGHYTRCHSLTPQQEARVRRIAAEAGR